MKERNIVKKYMDELTRPSTQRDRKKALDRGYEKHKRCLKTVGEYNG